MQRKSLLELFINVIILVCFNTIAVGQYKNNVFNSTSDPEVVIQQILFDPNNTSTWIINSGIFDQDFRISNTPGFEWPKGSGKFTIFTTGLSLGCYINFSGTPELREAMCSYKGEYAPGYVDVSASNPVAKTNSRFKFYKIKRGDNMYNNPDWVNWAYMIPYGAPFVDFNHNGVYEFFVDTPGVKNASITIFICLTDGFPEEHKIGEGFGGGTAPMFSEMHLTAWGYDNPGLEDIQFMRFDVVNKSKKTWDSTYAAIFSDTDLGDPNDDYIGCDTIRKLGYCYNSDNMDGTGSGITYGLNPPAVGFVWLGCGIAKNPGLKSFTYCVGTSEIVENCVKDPNGQAVPAYILMQGLKKDRTPWIVPNTNPPQITKFCYSGDPESGTGWTEYAGQIRNCGGSLNGELISPSPPGDRRIIMGTGAPNYKVYFNDTLRVIIARLVARGTNNKNSVTKLKQLADVAQQLCNNGFVIGIENISSEIPKEFALFQNYPNPFNPSTKIKFSIPVSPLSERGAGGFTTLKIFDLLGRELATLINGRLKPGTYKVSWDASNYPSGVYFYKLLYGAMEITRKMILLK